MKARNISNIAGLVVAVIVLLGAGTSRAGGININRNSISVPVELMLPSGPLGSGNGGVVGSVQDSGRHGGGPIDTTGKFVHDSLARAHRDSINRANHVHDSLRHLMQDSINRAHHLGDSLHRAIGDSINRANHVRDSIHQATMDSINRANHISDSIHHRNMDSINRANHVRDSIEHARQDSINNANNGNHTRDSLIRAHQDSLRRAMHSRDSLNHARQDSLRRLAHSRDSLGHVFRDSLRHVRHSIDSLIHIRIDSLIKFRHDTTHHGSIDIGNNGSELNKPNFSVEVPGEVVLAQNYPNPFGGAENATAIDFTVPTSQQVTIAVFNAAGQSVSTLVNGVVSAGTHSVTFNAGNLPAGIYFYKLATETGTMTKRMIKVH